MTKNYTIKDVVRTLTIQVDRKASENSEPVHFEFFVMIVRSLGGDHHVQVYRNDIYEIKPMSSDHAHENILVRDYFLVDDRQVFPGEAEAIRHIEQRLDDLFG